MIYFMINRNFSFKPLATSVFSTSLFLLLVFVFLSCQQTKCPLPLSSDSTSSSSGWTVLPSGIIGDLVGIHFTDTQTGYVGGVNGVIYKTSNGGASFQALPTNNTDAIYCIKFTDSNTGYAVGDKGTVLKTTDAGVSWTQLTVPDVLVNYRYIHLVNATTFFITPGGVGALYKTTDAGQSWTTIQSGYSGPIYKMFFPTPSVGYLGGGGARMMKTTDGGNTWSTLVTGIEYSQRSISSIYFSDVNNGFIVNSDVFANERGLIMRTTNGGQTWTEMQTPLTNQSISDIYFVDAQTGYVCGGYFNLNNSVATHATNAGFILKTTDGGSTWNKLNVTSSSLQKMSFINGNLAYITGLNGTVLKLQ
jgi:photosystem II stability/assembly factor-like uncharacterized protein